jgi:16S rRNA (cytidine1402-2'-O)-methyltransferase
VPGTLYLVSTPIGNLEDITLRAVRVLREVDWIACEDTRQTNKLLNYFAISTVFISYHEHNEVERATDLVKHLLDGSNVALVTDAGTPLISDPGYRVVAAAVAAGITVVPIPGASAALAALAASGLGTDAFMFRGFLPPRAAARRKILESLKETECTLIFYEAPHRILGALEDIEAVLGSRQVVVARELTKIHEEFLRGTASEIRLQLAARPSVKGEITLLIGRASAESKPADMPEAEDQVRQLQQQGLSRMDAVKRVAKARGIPKRELYRKIIS